MTDEERANEFMCDRQPYIASDGKAHWGFAESGPWFLYAEVMQRLEGGEARAGWLARRYNSRREAMEAARAAVLRCMQEGEL